jgi:hypothetical protein
MGLSSAERWVLIDRAVCEIDRSLEDEKLGQIVYGEIGGVDFASCVHRIRPEAISYLRFYLAAEGWASFACVGPNWLRFTISGDKKQSDGDLLRVMFSIGPGDGRLLDIVRENGVIEVETVNMGLSPLRREDPLWSHLTDYGRYR